MPRPSQRSRSSKRRQLRLPGGTTETRYSQKRTKTPMCSGCGRPLGGVPRQGPARLRGPPASQRRPERMYGGQLCPTCLRDLLKRRARGD